MIERREVVLGGLLTIMWGTGCSCSASAYEDGGPAGCTLEGEEAKAIFASGTLVDALSNDQKLIRSSGDKDLDYAIGRTVDRLSKWFGVAPGFSFMEGAKSMNAYASPDNLMNRKDGTVIFGLPYLAKMLRRPEAPDAHVAAVCAHEYGHILQYKHRLKPTLLAGQKTVKRLELHADFLGGYFAGLSKRRNPNYPAAVFAVDAYMSGDHKTERKSHHGTPDERASATVRGFEVAYRENHNLNDALQIGIKYVSKL